MYYGLAVFVYNPAGHSVLEVSATDYAACSTTTPIKRYATGNDIISVPAGPSYWICGIPSHCPAGQKFNITAAAGSSGPSSSVGTGNAVSILHVVAALAVALIASMSMWLPDQASWYHRSSFYSTEYIHSFP